MRRIRLGLFLGFLLCLAALMSVVFFISIHLAERYSRLDQETVLKLKKPITPDQEKKILNLTTPLLGSPPKASKPRVVLLGMDGLDFQYLDPLIKEGKLPNFKRVMEEGARSTLLSIIPPNSGGAWPVIVTGCNPGKTGLLHFRAYHPLSRSNILMDGRHLRRPTLWDILGDYGKKSITINEPMSYPPHKIQGVMVSGILAPEGSIFTYPEALSLILNEIGYKREAIPKGDGFFVPPSTLLSDLLLTERKRLELTLLLMERSDWDLLFCMFSSTDRMMHHLGRYFTHQDLEKNLLEMDHVLGALLEHLPEDATLLLVSDHGFDFYPKQFSVPRWLEKEGYWILPKQSIPKQTPLFRATKFLKRLREKTSVPDIPGVKWPQSLRRDDLCPPVDWEKTVAISVETGGNWGSIRILKEKERLTEEIVEKLTLLVDPKTGEKAVKKILRGEEIFIGPYQNRMPDLVFELSKIRADFAFSDQVFWEEPIYQHRQEGVFLGWGKGIRKNIVLPPSQVADIAPTVLYLLNLPIAEDLDGKVLKPLFEPSSFSLKTPHRIPHYPKKKIEWVGTAAPSGESSQDVKENLRSLGYLQ